MSVERMAPSTPSSDHLDRVGYLFGYPIMHSFSPMMHQTTYDHFNLKWSQLFLESKDMPHFLRLIREPKCFGASVTMPHKINILPHLDDMTPECRAVGACNTIFLRDGQDGKRQYVGTNTDVTGIRASFYKTVSNPDEVFHHRPGLVIGGGGAARSAVYAMRTYMNCSAIYIVNRDRSEVDAVIAHCKEQGYGRDLVHVETLEQARQLEGPGSIVACVPDFPPKTDAEKQARAVIECMLQKPHKGSMLEMCYHPNPWTELFRLAEKAGWHVILGTEAVIWQGLQQDKYWTGKDPDEALVAKIKENMARALDHARI